MESARSEKNNVIYLPFPCGNILHFTIHCNRKSATSRSILPRTKGTLLFCVPSACAAFDIKPPVHAKPTYIHMCMYVYTYPSFIDKSVWIYELEGIRLEMEMQPHDLFRRQLHVCTAESLPQRGDAE